jgi:hypothetical protein
MPQGEIPYFTVSVAAFVTPPYAAEMLTLVAAATSIVVMLKSADLAPAGTVTLAGTTATVFELRNVTAAPLDGAGPSR